MRTIFTPHAITVPSPRTRLLSNQMWPLSGDRGPPHLGSQVGQRLPVARPSVEERVTSLEASARAQGVDTGKIGIDALPKYVDVPAGQSSDVAVKRRSWIFVRQSGLFGCTGGFASGECRGDTGPTTLPSRWLETGRKRGREKSMTDGRRLDPDGRLLWYLNRITRFRYQKRKQETSPSDRRRSSGRNPAGPIVSAGFGGRQARCRLEAVWGRLGAS